MSETGRPRSYLSLVLAANAGFVDAAGCVALVGLFTAHQSGNTTGPGVAIGAGIVTNVAETFVVGLGGGIAGGMAETTWSYGSMAVPIAITAALALRDLRAP